MFSTTELNQPTDNVRIILPNSRDRRNKKIRGERRREYPFISICSALHINIGIPAKVNGGQILLAACVELNSHGIKALCPKIKLDITS